MASSRGDVRGHEIDRALDVMKHRGPDGPPGVWHDTTCVLGQSRLAIIDLSHRGRAPMSNERGTVWVTHNGEIYNFRQIRADLGQRGHRFQSASDTEVIVHAYEEWGPACVDRLKGMFAFAVWDAEARQLFLARDRVGKKPLFYVQRDDRIQFASEIQALLAFSDAPSRDPDFRAIEAYLSWGYIPAPLSGFSTIKKLPPGHHLLFDADRGTTRIDRYWSMDYLPKVHMDEKEAGSQLRGLLTEAVRLRLVSDVPVGAFLSGGIDSSIVVGLMAQLSSDPVRTFSIGFDVASYTEVAHARRIAEKWGTVHEEHIVEPNAAEVLPLLVRHFGEPYADSSALPTYYVSRVTASAVTVALNGDGGDESFAGYERYRANRLAERLCRYGMAPPASRIGSLLADSTDPKSIRRRIRRFLSVGSRPMPARYAHWMSYFSDIEKGELIEPGFRDLVRGETSKDWFTGLFDLPAELDPVDRAMAVDIVSYLPYDLLVKVDITAMANSLETRSPFLDHDVMEFAARLPARLKLKGSSSKYLLKKEFADLLPPANVKRKKMGFGVPIAHWFRGPLRALLEEHLHPDVVRDRGYLRPQVVTHFLHEHLSNEADHSAKLWNLLMLEMWHREMVDKAPIHSAEAAPSGDIERASTMN